MTAYHFLFTFNSNHGFIWLGFRDIGDILILASWEISATSGSHADHAVHVPAYNNYSSSCMGKIDGQTDGRCINSQ